MTRSLRCTPRITIALGVLALCAALPASRVQDTARPAPAPASTSASTSVPEAGQAQRERILEIARSYAEFEWQGAGGNVLHGPDADGTYVDTPDVSFDPKGWNVEGGTNHGMPYAWGGFTSIDEFREGLAQGRPAGQVPTTEHVDASRFALGLDCSGYIARCWDVPVKQSTRSLGALCYELPDYDALQPGDILLLVDSHVVLFDRWLDDAHAKLSVFEAARLSVTTSVYTAEKLKAAGFLPMRYKPLDTRWVPMAMERPAFALPLAPDASLQAGRWEPQSVAAPDPAASAPLAPLAQLATVTSPLADAQPLEWARYVVSGEGASAADVVRRATMVSTVEGGAVELQTDSALLGGTIATGTRCEQPQSVLEALLDFAASDEPLSRVELDACTVTPGEYVLGERRFPATRIEAQLHATRVMRHQDFPVTLSFDVVLSPEVPVHGVLEARVRRETVWRAEPPEQRAVSRSDSSFQLESFGGVGGAQ